MKADFTRDSFQPGRAYTRVLSQQGRVQLDADWNEQMSILWDYFRSAITDLVGPHAGPHGQCGFQILTPAELAHPRKDHEEEEERRRLAALLQSGGDFIIGPGRYYVDGFPCRQDSGFVAYTDQPFRPGSAALAVDGKPYLVYLDAFERHVLPLQDPAMAEVALAHVDTTTRAQLVWQVRVLELPAEIHGEKELLGYWPDVQYGLRARHRAYLRARARLPADEEPLEAVLAGPEARYRGAENHLYRVEIHHPGRIGDHPTFKWSRDNGSVVFAIASVEGRQLTLADSARDWRDDLAAGDWVEVLDDGAELRAESHPLLRVEEVDPNGRVVTLSDVPAALAGPGPHLHPLLRRWDQKAGDPKQGGFVLHEGAALIEEGSGDGGWFTLEDGVQIQFVQPDPAAHYSTGDYWLIPARTAIGDVVWPQRGERPEAQRPHGPRHVHAPLALLEFDKEGRLALLGDCRRKIRHEA